MLWGRPGRNRPQSRLRSVAAGHYTLGSLIGRGRAAEVYRAYDERLARPVAVKIFDTSVAGVEQAQQRCAVSTLAGLNHPGVVKVYDVAEDNGRAFVVMQLIEGESLAERLEAGPLTVNETLRLGAALADAIAYAHRHGVAHGAIKPSNVLLDAADQPYLSDFAPAAALSSTQITSSGPVLGTCCYLSPEQVRGQPVGAPADVYSLGLMLAECLTGHREYFSTADHYAVARRHRPLPIPPQLPTAVGTLLRVMTEDEPTARPSATNVAGDLRAMTGEQCTAWPWAGQVADPSRGITATTDVAARRGANIPTGTSTVTLPASAQTDHHAPTRQAAGVTAVAADTQVTTNPAAGPHRDQVTEAQDHWDTGHAEQLEALDALLGRAVDAPPDHAVTAVSRPHLRPYLSKRGAALLATGTLVTILAPWVFVVLTSGGAMTNPPVGYHESPRSLEGGSPAIRGGEYQPPSGENGVVADGAAFDRDRKSVV